MAADQLNAVWPLGVEAMLSKKKNIPKNFSPSIRSPVGKNRRVHIVATGTFDFVSSVSSDPLNLRL